MPSHAQEAPPKRLWARGLAGVVDRAVSLSNVRCCSLGHPFPHRLRECTVPVGYVRRGLHLDDLWGPRPRKRHLAARMARSRVITWHASPARQIGTSGHAWPSYPLWALRRRRGYAMHLVAAEVARIVRSLGAGRSPRPHMSCQTQGSWPAPRSSRNVSCCAGSHVFEPLPTAHVDTTQRIELYNSVAFAVNAAQQNQRNKLGEMFVTSLADRGLGIRMDD